MTAPALARLRQSGLRGVTAGAPAYPLVVLFGLNLVNQLDQNAFAILAPNIRDAFGLNLAAVTTIAALAVPMSFLLGVPLAYYADRINRIRIAIAGAAVWSVFSVVTGLAVNVAQLVLTRIGSGLAHATNNPTHNSLLADYYPPQVRPGIYAVWGSAQFIGALISPVAAGLLGYFFNWRVPFLVFAVPTMVFVLMALRLREPARGVQDRLALGATAEEAAVEETPPTFSESYRLLMSVKAVRRTMLALPFLGASLLGFQLLLSLFMSDVYHVNTALRGVLTAAGAPFSLIGLAIGAPLAQRLMARDPGLVLRMLGSAGFITAASFLVMAVSPDLAIFVGASFVQGAVFAVLVPGIFSIGSLIIPAKTRSLGFQIVTLALLPGVLILPVIGTIGDRYGLRLAISLMAPVYLAGSFLIASAGRFVAADIERVRVMSMAEHEVRRALGEGLPKLLLVRGLDVAYDQVQVLFEVDFELRPGEIVALLGTNGAGKSTLLKAISGLVDPVGGAIYFDDLDITHIDPVRTFKLGVVQMPGGRSVFPTLTVEEHLKLAGAMLPDDPDHVARATEEVIGLFPRLRERWDQAAGNLSGGEQQMLGLALALVARPKLLMIDELSLGLAPSIVEQLLDVIRRIHAQGTAIILVEQSVNVALAVAERAYFMEKGQVRFHGRTAELLDRGDILRAVFLEGGGNGRTTTRSGRNGSGRPGRAAAKPRDAGTGAPAERRVVLDVSDLSRSFGGIRAVTDVSFVLHADEILGLIGPNGAGKTTVFDLISGFLTPDSGRVLLEGQDITAWPADRRARGGLGRSFQDARIFASLTVAENLAVSLERHLRVRDHLADALRLPEVVDQEDDVRFTVEQLIDLMNLGAFRDKFVSELSTGSRRIVDLAMAIAHDPKLLILDEPSSGIAQRETEALGPLLQRIHRDVGCAILVIEHDMPLITGISHRMLALELGTIIAEGPPGDVISNPRVVSSYLGGDPAAINRSGTVRRRRTATTRAKVAAATPARAETEATS
ncbi:MAG TPA: MFS transporter [Acidimicrobiales bacterium]|nr:MFS transporter [Acidimicrobiales bacterium]